MTHVRTAANSSGTPNCKYVIYHTVVKKLKGYTSISQYVQTPIIRIRLFGMKSMFSPRNRFGLNHLGGRGYHIAVVTPNVLAGKKYVHATGGSRNCKAVGARIGFGYGELLWRCVGLTHSFECVVGRIRGRASYG